MKTEIIQSPKSFTPVTLQMTFETEDELAVFLSVLSGTGISTFNSLSTNNERLALALVNCLIPYDLWYDLRGTVRDNKFSVHQNEI